MPTLKLFKRTWKYAEDEFVTSSLVFALIRLILVLVAGILLFGPQTRPHIDVPGAEEIFITTTVICSVQICTYVAMLIISSRGGVMQTERRKALQPVMVFHMFLLPTEFVFYCLSIWKSSETVSQESSPALTAVICWCAIGMALVLFSLLGWVRHYDKNGAEKYKFFKTFYYDKKTSHELTGDMETLLKKMHEISLEKWTNFVRQKVAELTEPDEEMRQEAIEEASSTLADYMSDLDLTRSDVFMGLLLLRWQSAQWIGNKSALDAQYVLDNTDPITTDVAAEVIHKQKTNNDSTETMVGTQFT
nr:unnamed protein product [Spirometra erinaceieuropaei]